MKINMVTTDLAKKFNAAINDLFAANRLGEIHTAGTVFGDQAVTVYLEAATDTHIMCAAGSLLQDWLNESLALGNSQVIYFDTNASGYCGYTLYLDKPISGRPELSKPRIIIPAWKERAEFSERAWNRHLADAVYSEAQLKKNAAWLRGLENA